MIRLYNVIDIRTNQFHSVAVIKEENRQYFVEVDEEDDDSSNS